MPASLRHRVTAAILGIILAYLVFFLLPQTLVLFGPFVGMTSPVTGASILSKIQDLLIPAAVLGVLYPMSLRTKVEGVMTSVLGFAMIIFLLYALEGGSVSIATVQTTSAGLQMSVETAASFMPLLYLLMIPIGVFIAKGCYLSYSAMKEPPAPPPEAPTPGALAKDEHPAEAPEVKPPNGKETSDFSPI